MALGDRLATSFEATLSDFDRAFAEGDADAFAALLDDAVELHWNDQATVRGRSDVDGAFRGVFAAFDTSAFEPTHHTIEVHADAAYVMSDFTETLRPREGGPATQIQGRLVVFWRIAQSGWRITRILTARSAPDQQTS